MINIIKYITIRKQKKSKLRNFLEHSEFLDQLHKEKMRSDRTLNVFTLIVFKSVENKRETLNQWMQEIAMSVATCSRLTDCKGWYNKEENAVGLILSDTKPEVAEKIIKKIKNDFLRKIGTALYNSFEDLVKIEIYSYPTGQTLHWEDNSDCLQYVCDNTELFCITLPQWKRFLDVLLSLLLLLILMPLMIAIAFLIKITSQGPVFYKQQRMGFGNTAFKMLKFRTMYCRSDERMHEEHVVKLIKESNEKGKSQPLEKLANDPRITPIGILLRKTSLDELPQLINVLKGDMSLVGPRPCMPYEARELTLWQRNRLLITPGITGLWQTNGKNKTTFMEMIRYDIRYGRSINFWNDIRIILKTPKTITTDLIDYAKSFVTEKFND